MRMCYVCNVKTYTKIKHESEQYSYRLRLKKWRRDV